MYTKIIGVCIVIAACSMIGMKYGQRKKNRLHQLKSLKRDFTLLRGDISFGLTPMAEAVYHLSVRNESIFTDFFACISEELDSCKGTTFFSVWEKAVHKYLQKTDLTEKDIRSLLEFGENIGYLDKEMQISTIDLYLLNLDEDIKEMTGRIKEIVRLYQILGILGGVFLSIVMI